MSPLSIAALMAEAASAVTRFCQNAGLAGLGSPHPRNGEGTRLACPDWTSTATTKQKGRTALGSRRFRCRACRRRFHDRTGTPFNDRQDPTDIVRLAVRWRLRDTLGFRDGAERLLQRGVEVTHETIRAWEGRFAPRRADELRAKRRGPAGRSWSLDETDVPVAGRWCALDRAIDREGGSSPPCAARAGTRMLPGASCGAWSTWPSARRRASRRMPLRPTGGRSAGSWGERCDPDASNP